MTNLERFKVVREKFATINLILKMLIYNFLFFLLSFISGEVCNMTTLTKYNELVQSRSSYLYKFSMKDARIKGVATFTAT